MAKPDSAVDISDFRAITPMARREDVPPAATRGVAAIDRLSRLLRHLQRDIARAEERADEIAFEIVALQRAVRADATGRLSKIAGEALQLARDARRRRRRQEAIRNAAVCGARKVDIRMMARGGAAVRFDDGKAIDLPRTVASLLRVLVYAAVPGADGFPEWQSFETVSAELGKKTGRKPSHHAVTQIVYRLRQMLADGGVNPFLVQVNRRRGLRLLVRK